MPKDAAARRCSPDKQQGERYSTALIGRMGNGRKLRQSQRAEVWIADVADQSARLVYTSESVLLEAPNWAPDGQGLLLNGDGLLWRLDLRPSGGP